MMLRFFKDIFAIEKNPKKGFLALEWVMLAYLVFTLLMIFFTYTKLTNPESMIWGRARIFFTTVALWAVYRMIPCRFTRFARVFVQMSLLAWWYPDTYELNRIFPNLNHLFAAWEQSLFGCQPALLFSHYITSPVFSELMDLGYASYFPMILVVLLFFFVFRYKEFERAAFIVTASFFLYYLIFVFLPVTGPQYYYNAVGMDSIAHGVFPNLHDYFNFHSARLVSPGYTDGVFYHLVEGAHDAGERPTAAFPSSHVGITMVLMMLACHSRNRILIFSILPLFILMFFSTVYIQAHYAVDAIAGIISGAIFYFIFLYTSRRMKF